MIKAPHLCELGVELNASVTWAEVLSWLWWVMVAMAMAEPLMVWHGWDMGERRKLGFGRFKI